MFSKQYTETKNQEFKKCNILGSMPEKKKTFKQWNKNEIKSQTKSDENPQPKMLINTIGNSLNVEFTYKKSNNSDPKRK